MKSVAVRIDTEQRRWIFNHVDADHMGIKGVVQMLIDSREEHHGGADK